MKTLFVTLALLISQVAFTQQGIITPEKKEAIKAYVQHFEKNNQLMGTLSIFEDGKEVVNHTFGEKNISKGTSERKYTIGSITKLFTSVLFAKLQEADKISLDEKLSKYFPKVPNANKINIRQMLNHTSGLKNYVSKSDSLHFWLKAPQTKETIINEIISQGVAFEPGDSLSYSNSAYYLLGRILEQQYRKTFEQVLADEITTPLGLKNTLSIAEGGTYDNIANSYEKKRGEWKEMEEFYFPNAYSAGAMASTAYEMNTFLNALFTGKVIKRETLQAMLPKKNDWFGLGVMKAPFYDHIGYGHGGDTYGTHSMAAYNPENKLTLTYIVNGENYPTNDFGIGVLSIIYDKEYELPEFKTYKPEERFFELYAGTYGSDDLPITIKIYEEEGSLMAQGSGQPSFALNPIEKHVFDYQPAKLEIEFKPFENTFILKQGGQTFELKKQ